MYRYCSPRKRFITRARVLRVTHVCSRGTDIAERWRQAEDQDHEDQDHEDQNHEDQDHDQDRQHVREHGQEQSANAEVGGKAQVFTAP